MIFSFINNIFPYIFFNKSKIKKIKSEKYVSLALHISDEFQFYYLDDKNRHLKPFTNPLHIKGKKINKSDLLSFEMDAFLAPIIFHFTSGGCCLCV